MLCKREKCLLNSSVPAFVLSYKPEEEASSGSQDVPPQAVSSLCLPFSRPEWKHQPAELTCLREQTDCETSSTMFFRVSQICAWIVSGWQMSGIHTSIPWLCWQVCLHNFFFLNCMFTLPDTVTVSSTCALEDLTSELLHRFRVWPPPESAAALHREKGCDKALMV